MNSKFPLAAGPFGGVLRKAGATLGVSRERGAVDLQRATIEGARKEDWQRMRFMSAVAAG